MSFGFLATTRRFTVSVVRDGEPVSYATKLAMHTLGRRILAIDADGARLDGELAGLVRATAPSLLELHGVGTHTAAILLVPPGTTANGSPPRRITIVDAPTLRRDTVNAPSACRR